MTCHCDIFLSAQYGKNVQIIVNKQPVKGVFSFIFHKFVASMWHLVVTTTGRFREVTFY